MENYLLTIKLFIVSFSSTRGLDGGELQLANNTSPGSYRSRSVHRIGFVSGNSVYKKNGKRKFVFSIQTVIKQTCRNSEKMKLIVNKINFPASSIKKKNWKIFKNLISTSR